MENTFNRVDHSSRLSFRALAAGGAVVFASLLLLETLAAALGIWRFDLSAIAVQGPRFWLWSYGAWVVSLFIGSWYVSYASRSMNAKDGMLHGVALWAMTCLTGCALLGVFSGKMLDFAGAETTSGVYLAAFGADVLALLAAVWGGRLQHRADPTEDLRSVDVLRPKERSAQA